MKDAIIVAKGIYKTYDTGKVRVEALRGVDLEVTSGEMVAIMGPSGCGKTTLLNCLSGLDSTDQGEIWIDGSELHKLPDDQRSDYRARRMGFVFQLYNLLPVLKAVENVELPLLVSGVNSRQARKVLHGDAGERGAPGLGQPSPRGALGRPAPAGDHSQGPGEQSRHRLGR